MKIFLFAFCIFFVSVGNAQNVGIGTPIPSEKLDVDGNIKSNGLVLNIPGAANDFLIKGNTAGQTVTKKGSGGLGLNYIIAISITNATYPLQGGGSNQYNVTLIGEIKLFAGNFAPNGWALCQGQLLSIATYEVLFNLIGTTYGGDGQNNFAVPDLRGAVPVQQGTRSASTSWDLGERSN